jgi:hypothetical protein
VIVANGSRYVQVRSSNGTAGANKPGTDTDSFNIEIQSYANVNPDAEWDIINHFEAQSKEAKIGAPLGPWSIKKVAVDTCTKRIERLCYGHSPLVAKNGPPAIPSSFL